MRLLRTMVKERLAAFVANSQQLPNALRLRELVR